MSPAIRPERGFNTMAAALEEAAESSPIIQRHLDKNKAKILSDTRNWLVRLVATDQGISSVLMTNALANTSKLSIARRMRDLGLIELRKGFGTIALDKLRDLARRGDVTDEWLSGIIWPHTRRQQEEAAAQPEPEPDGQPSEPELPAADSGDDEYHPRPTPTHRLNAAARRARIIDDVRDWLIALSKGKRARVAQLTGQMSGNGGKYGVLARMKDAGLVQVVPVDDTGFGKRYVGVFPAIEYAKSMTDEQLASLIWKRARVDEPGVIDAPYEDNEPVGSVVDPAPVPPPMGASPSDVIDLIASRIGDIGTVLVRLDARLARLERELGLPPIEQDVPKTEKL